MRRANDAVDRRKGEISMIPKISMAAAFLLLAAPPIASASNCSFTNSAPLTCQADQSPQGIVIAQDSSSDGGTSASANGSDNDNDSDSSDSADDNQNSDDNQADQQNASGDDQQQASPDDNLGNTQQAPQQANPYQ
jgi:hypothetical protein